jgi:hypothetical protein
MRDVPVQRECPNGSVGISYGRSSEALVRGSGLGKRTQAGRAASGGELKMSCGVRQSRHFRGRRLSFLSAFLTCAEVTFVKSVPLGKYRRIRPLDFSLSPRSQEW